MDNLEIFGVPYLKGGSGIHIKKENRGLFTDYCEGKVTNECIQRGKNSSDPKIRKRATFAQNARGWSKKHQIGGPVEYKGPTYSEVQEQWKKEDPTSYNIAQMNIAMKRGDSNEIVTYTDANGNVKLIPKVVGMSGTDPVGSYVVETVASVKPLQLVGKGVQYGLANLPKIQKALTHPTWQKIYHGSPFNFTWKTARPYSRANVGLHVSTNKNIAQSFSGNVNNIMEGYAPKPKVETIDIGFNNYNLLNTKYPIQARPLKGYDNYDIVLPDSKRLEMLKQAGAKPTVTLKNKSILGDQYKLNTENSVNLNLRKELKLSKSANQKADDIMERAKKVFDDKDEILNKETTELLSNDGIKTIRYNNVNPMEGGGGESWILTDPYIVWNPTWKPVHINPRLEKLSPIIPLIHD